MTDPSLPLTGERTVPGVWYENYWYQRHVAAYRFARARLAGLRVLDAGCGEGYGTSMLAERAAEAVGVELVPEVVAHARRTYPHVEFVEAELGALPFEDASFDAVVSFQVIEHLWDVTGYLRELARVLRPGGQFLCATPNRLTFTPGSDTPRNPFHVEEFTAAELRDRLTGPFSVEAVLGVRHGRRLRLVEGLAQRSFPDLVLAAPPDAWPAWLRGAVRAVRPGDFPLRAERVDASLDLLAIARRP